MSIETTWSEASKQSFLGFEGSSENFLGFHGEAEVLLCDVAKI